MTQNIVIAGYARAPFTQANKGALKKVRADELITQVVQGLIERSGVTADDIEDLILGCAFPEGEQGFNLARLVVLNAKLPRHIAGTTVNRFCGSSMQSIHMAAGALAWGYGKAYICAGVESMTRVPMSGFNPMPNPKLMEEEPGAYMGMGFTAENLAQKYQISREAQEAYAVESHRKAAEAQAAGRLKDEIVPITLEDGSVCDQDGCIRPGTTAEKLADLKPAFKADGIVTAGTSSPLTDGASAVLVTTEDYAKANGLTVMAKIRSFAVNGCDPTIMGIGPVGATKKAIERAGISLSDLGIIESNEAFAVQTLSCAQELGQDLSITNLDGGALAMGHPLGATGARITGKAAQLLGREDKELALSTQCIGGGQGIATVLERVA